MSVPYVGSTTHVGKPGSPLPTVRAFFMLTGEVIAVIAVVIILWKIQVWFAISAVIEFERRFEIKNLCFPYYEDDRCCGLLDKNHPVAFSFATGLFLC